MRTQPRIRHGDLQFEQELSTFLCSDAFLPLLSMLVSAIVFSDYLKCGHHWPYLTISLTSTHMKTDVKRIGTVVLVSLGWRA